MPRRQTRDTTWPPPCIFLLQVAQRAHGLQPRCRINRLLRDLSDDGAQPPPLAARPACYVANPLAVAARPGCFRPMSGTRPASHALHNMSLLARARLLVAQLLARLIAARSIAARSIIAYSTATRSTGARA